MAVRGELVDGQRDISFAACQAYLPRRVGEPWESAVYAHPRRAWVQCAGVDVVVADDDAVDGQNGVEYGTRDLADKLGIKRDL